MPASVLDLYSHPTNPLYSELRHAIQSTSPDVLRAWSIRSAKRVGSLLNRRGGNLITLAARLIDGAWYEIKGVKNAAVAGTLPEHAKQRAKAAAQAIDAVGSKLVSSVGALKQALEQSPEQTAITLLSLALAFRAGSGGLDGNGGVPDTDITILGIGEHRAFLTHSVISGALVEATVLALADLIGTLHKQLPTNHSKFWDKLLEINNQAARPLTQGFSAGIAYHLAVDGLLQPAAYKDLPFPMPIEGHQAVFAINAVAEGADIRNKARSPITDERPVGAIEGTLRAAVKAYKARRHNYSPEQRRLIEKAEALRALRRQQSSR